MWSDKYHYFNIQKDNLLSEECDTAALRKYLAGFPELEQTSDYAFKNRDSFPFMRLTLLKVKSRLSWSDKESDSKRTNFLAVVCTKGDAVNSQKIISVLIQIASFLNWELIEEETDEGIEDYRVWEPKRSASKLD